MPRCVNHLQTEFVALESIAVSENVVRSECLVLMPAHWRHAAELWRAACLREQCRRRRMIRMRMRDENRFDRAIGKPLDRIDVIAQRRSRVDDGNFLNAQQVSIRPTTRHYRGIRRDQPAHARRQFSELLPARTHQLDFPYATGTLVLPFRAAGLNEQA